VESRLSMMVGADEWDSFAKTLNRRSQPGLFILNVHQLRLCLSRTIGSSPYANGGRRMIKQQWEGVKDPPTTREQ
jgi:hypothetical protein